MSRVVIPANNGNNEQELGDGVNHLPSTPPTGKCVVTNLFVDPDTGRLIVEYEDESVE